LPAPTLAERVAVCKKHLRKSVEWKGPKVGIFEMRRHYTNYLKGLPGIKDYRARLVTLMEPAEIESVLDEVTANYEGYEFERMPIELIDYHQKCPIN
jgi:tRNA-dihydrouridine synthase